MSGLEKVSIEKDAKLRVEWLSKRITLTEMEKEYIEFQLLEAVKSAMTPANDIGTSEATAILPDVSNRSFNELEMLAEDLECVKMWLDNKNVPTHDNDNNQYSVIGRIELLLNGC